MSSLHILYLHLRKKRESSHEVKCHYNITLTRTSMEPAYRQQWLNLFYEFPGHWNLPRGFGCVSTVHIHRPISVTVQTNSSTRDIHSWYDIVCGTLQLSLSNLK